LMTFEQARLMQKVARKLWQEGDVARAYLLMRKVIRETK